MMNMPTHLVHSAVYNLSHVCFSSIKVISGLCDMMFSVDLFPNCFLFRHLSVSMLITYLSSYNVTMSMIMISSFYFTRTMNH